MTLWTDEQKLDAGVRLKKKFTNMQCPQCERKSALFRRRSKTGYWENCRHCGYTGHIND